MFTHLMCFSRECAWTSREHEHSRGTFTWSSWRFCEGRVKVLWSICEGLWAVITVFDSNGCLLWVCHISWCYFVRFFTWSSRDIHKMFTYVHGSSQTFTWIFTDFFNFTWIFTNSPVNIHGQVSDLWEFVRIWNLTFFDFWIIFIKNAGNDQIEQKARIFAVIGHWFCWLFLRFSWFRLYPGPGVSAGALQAWCGKPTAVFSALTPGGSLPIAA